MKRPWKVETYNRGMERWENFCSRPTLLSALESWKRLCGQTLRRTRIRDIMSGMTIDGVMLG